MLKLSIALLALLLSAPLALAAGTVNTTLSTTAFTDLGTAPVIVQALGGGIRLVIADSLPAATTVGLYVGATGIPLTLQPADASSHVYALALNPGATAVVAPITTP